MVRSPRCRPAVRRGTALATAAVVASCLVPALAPAALAAPGAPADRLLARTAVRPALSRERFYFVMTDRFANGDRRNDTGGLSGDRLATGHDPTDIGFYHGGDLAGLISRLDYIKGLGTTAVWITPVFRNRPVQGRARTPRRATTATGSPTSPASTRTWAPTRT
ncbi:alpha-amylase family glycosyl hydrolase [Actinomadura keratinilytica]|uniref:alpha-amylase family glycosyl hydrolase n=1 Tax=Actinomadura keratinilytica TaxID=547461 RepID=UPI00360B94EA